MHLAIIGDRGIPARYSGFSTLVEELSVRLVQDHGCRVTVYSRKPYFESHPPAHRGVELVWHPAPGGKSFESVLHTTRAVWHASRRGCYDLVFIVDPGNGPFCLPLKARGVPVVFHTDGLGWKRTKWNRLQRAYYKWSERATARLGDWLVTDSRAMVRYYQDAYKVPCSFIPYGSIVGAPPDARVLAEHGLEPGGYYLLVARMEPENNSLLIMREFKRTRTRKPLVVVGSVPYASAYARQVMAESDERVRAIGSIYDSSRLNALWANCYAYLHGHEVGDTNPSLLRAMGTGAACIPLEVPFNREVVGPLPPGFGHEPGSLCRLIDAIDQDPAHVRRLGDAARQRAAEAYRWDAVAAGYAAMFRAVLAERTGSLRRADLAATEFYRPGQFAGREDWLVESTGRA